VSPVVSTTTFFTLILSWLFLGKRDPVTARIVIDAILIVASVVLVTVIQYPDPWSKHKT
jgi:drug/metabolite transporter (DMT)-like permease